MGVCFGGETYWKIATWKIEQTCEVGWLGSTIDCENGRWMRVVQDCVDWHMWFQTQQSFATWGTICPLTQCR